MSIIQISTENHLITAERGNSFSRTPQRKVTSSIKGSQITTPYEPNKQSTMGDSTPNQKTSLPETGRKSIFEELEILKKNKKTNEKEKSAASLKLKQNSSSLLKNVKFQSTYCQSKYFDDCISSATKLPENIYGKGMKKLEKKQEKIGKTKKLLIKKETEGMQSRPVLSPNTKNIIRNKLADVKPIYQRVDQIVEEKRREMDYLAVKYEEPIYQKNTGRYDKKKFDSWVEENSQWNNKKNFKILDRKMKMESEEISFVKKMSTMKHNTNPMNKTFDNISLEPIYVRYDFRNQREKEKKEEKKVKKCHSPFISRKCPNFNSFLKSNSKKENQNSSFVISTNRELDSNHINDFRFCKTTKNKKESLFLTKKETISSNKKNSHSTKADDDSKFSRWQDSIHLVNTFRNNFSFKEEIDSLYKINVRNNLAWDSHKENNIIFTSKYKRILKNLFE